MNKPAIIDSPVPSLDAYIGLVRAYEKLQQSNRALFRNYGLTQSQYNVLRILYTQAPDNGMTQKDIAAKLLQPVPDISRMIARMDRDGLIQRGKNQSDRREVRISLSKNGIALVEKVHEPMLRNHEQMFESFSPSELGRFRQLINKLIQQ